MPRYVEVWPDADGSLDELTDGMDIGGLLKLAVFTMSPFGFEAYLQLAPEGAE